ncbi:MAG TPA: hypothetical protein VFA56_02385 [Gaiellaceae bacterium]|nr:hypothetical protein [Gaiellaceae bacterium]
MDAALGALAAAAALVATAPYIVDTARGRTRPHRGTWLIWSTLSLIALLSQRADGASWSLLVVAGQFVSTASVLALAIVRKHGEGGTSVAEIALLALAGIGVVGWAVADDPAIATAAVVAADLVGVLLMLPKTYRDPWSETLSTFVLGGVSGMLGAAAVGRWAPSLLLYPAYIVAADSLTVATIAIRRSAHRRSITQ